MNKDFLCIFSSFRGFTKNCRQIIEELTIFNTLFSKVEGGMASLQFLETGRSSFK